MGLRHFFLCMLLPLAFAPASAVASGWSGLGGGAGRSGHDAFDHGATTNVIGSWSQTATAEQDVEAGPVISDGIPGTQRVVYGTGLGALHVQMLSNGMQVGPQAGHDIDDGAPDSDTFGGGDAIVSPVIASSPLSPGQVYALHNDENLGTGLPDISLAQVDLATGARVRDLTVPGTDGYELRSSPVLTEPDAGGDASLFFVASDGVTPLLFRFDIDDVQTSGASFAANSSSTGVSANMLASPALVYLNDLAGTPTLYVAVGTSGSNVLETYAVSDFSPGPHASAIGTAEGETPSVPLTSDGLLPGALGSGMDTSPWIYMATVATAGNRVNRLEQFGNDQILGVVSSSVPLSGVPAHALAVSKRVGDDPAEGVVAYTTNNDLYLLNSDLTYRDEYSPSGTQNFGRTTAALSDDLVFAMLADGSQKVLRTSDATEFFSPEFTENAANASSLFAKGQPALAGGRVIFPSDIGAFAYTTRDGTPSRVGNLGPPSVLGGGTLEAVAADARGINDVQFLIDGTPVAMSTNPVSGLSHTPSGGRFIAGWDAGGTAPGEHTLEAVATDNGGQTTSAKAVIVVEPHTFADTDPPETTIEAGPRGRTADTTPRFRFSSSESPEAFECSLDGKRFRSCPARPELAFVAGRHRLSVRALDAAGNVDPSPSARSFTVLAPGPIEVAATRPLELNRRGKVAVPVTCHSRRRCRGLLVVYAIVPRAGAGSVRAAPARKGRKLRVGKRRFSVSARTRRKVLVRVSAAGRRLLRRNGRVKALARVKLNTPTGVERSSWALTLTDKDN
jgi:hypothetical protein